MILVYNIKLSLTYREKNKQATISNKMKIYLGKGKETLNFFAKKISQEQISINFTSFT